MRRRAGTAFAFILACVLLPNPVLSQVQGGSCNTLNKVYSPWYLGYATGTTVICDGSVLQNLMTATASPLRLSIFGPVAIGTSSQTLGTALDLGTNTNSLLLPVGTTGQRPGTGINGMIRYNSSTPALEAYVNGSWSSVLTSGPGTVNLGTSATAANPQILGDTTTGLYTPNASTVAVSAGGIEVMQWNTAGGGVNFLSITPGATGVAPTIGNGGSDTNGAGLGLALTGKAATAAGAGGAITLTSGAGNGAGAGGAISGTAGTGGATGTGGAVSITAGNVGGGTNKAGGDVTITAGSSTGTSGSNIIFKAATKGAVSGTASYGTAEVMRVDADGAVGVGTGADPVGTTTARKLYISGGEVIDNSYGRFVGTQSSWGPYMTVNHAYGPSYSAPYNALVATGDTVGGFHAGSGASTNKNDYALIGMADGYSAGYEASGAINAIPGAGYYLPGIGFAGQTDTNAGSGMHIGASILGVTDGAVSSGVLPTAIVMHTSQTNDTGLTERLRITSAGNIGIGTNSPQATLDVNGYLA